MIMAVQQQVNKVGNCIHYWIIDSENVGHCKYCAEVRDFGRLLQRAGVFVAAGRRGSKARQETVGKKRGRQKKEPANAKMSAAAMERWQDPEYRAKMSRSKGRKLKYE